MQNDSTSAPLAPSGLLNAVAVSEGEICKALNSYFAGNCAYKLANAYIFKRDWESDFFVQKQNGYSYEFEVKISRSDFFSDRKKIDKHNILELGGYYRKVWYYNDEKQKHEYKNSEVITEHTMRPNKFFYVVPEGMIAVDELPPYAGLFYFGSGLKYNWGLLKVKDAPFIHKEVFDFSKILCGKFYNYWLNEKAQVAMLKREIERLKAGSNGI